MCLPVLYVYIRWINYYITVLLYSKDIIQQKLFLLPILEWSLHIFAEKLFLKGEIIIFEKLNSKKIA